jgi:hypothetical protein
MDMTPEQARSYLSPKDDEERVTIDAAIIEKDIPGAPLCYVTLVDLDGEAYVDEGIKIRLPADGVVPVRVRPCPETIACCHDTADWNADHHRTGSLPTQDCA